MDLDDIIRQFVEEFHFPQPRPDFDESYQAIFGDEGSRKASYIVDGLRKYEDRDLLDTKRLCYLSIGGADGSEAAHVLRETGIAYAAMIEISDDAAEAARQLSSELNAEGASLKVFQGDAAQRLPDAMAYLKSLKQTVEIDGLVVSAQAVLHELPSRSPGFDMLSYLGTMFKDFDINLLFAREPISSQSWPKRVRLKIGNASSETLHSFARLLRDTLHFPRNEITPITGGQVLIDSDLALEVLHKLIRSNSSQEFSYEMGERLTTIESVQFQKLVDSLLGPDSCTVEPLVTDGFQDAYRNYEVEVFDNDGHRLSMPHTHARFVAISKKKI